MPRLPTWLLPLLLAAAALAAAEGFPDLATDGAATCFGAATLERSADAALGPVLILDQPAAADSGGLAIASLPVTGGGQLRIACALRGRGLASAHLVQRDGGGGELRRDTAPFGDGAIALGPAWRRCARLLDLDPATARVELRVLFHRQAGRVEVAAATATRAEPLTTAADDAWLALPERSWAVDAGSVLDFTGLVPLWPIDAAHRVVADAAGHLAFAGDPGRRVRLFGTNLMYSACFPAPDEAGALADGLRRCGYNAVRLHHFDDALLPAGAAALDAGRLDRLDRLVAALAARGLRVVYDLYVSRRLDDAHLAGAAALDPNDLKARFALDPAALAEWRRFAALLLAHRNPYRGLTWAEDPVFAAIAPANEDVLHVYLGRPRVAALLAQRFAAAGGGQAGDPAQDGPFIRWLTGTQEEALERQTSILRNELGARALIAGPNDRAQPGLTRVRRHGDLVEMHGYWDHPRFLGARWSLPARFTQESAVAAGAALPLRWAGARLFGKPFQLTETASVFPNRFRAEAGILVGAYAALQDWDGIYRYGHLGSGPGEPLQDPLSAQAMQGFRSAYDPIALLGDRVAALLFARGDVRAADACSVWLAGDADLPPAPGRGAWPTATFPPAFSARGLLHRIGCVDASAPFPAIPGVAAVIGRQAAPAGTPLPALRPEDLPAPAAAVRSETGEIAIDAAAGTLRVATARSEALILGPGELAGERMTAASADARTVLAVAAIDDRPLGVSRRLLVLHLTDVRNTGMILDDDEATILRAWGRLPQLVRRGRATLHLRLDAGPAPRAWAVDLSGRRLDELAVARTEDGAWRLELDTRRAAGAALAYEIIR